MIWPTRTDNHEMCRNCMDKLKTVMLGSVLGLEACQRTKADNVDDSENP
jgi:hypothetical protein